MVLRGWSIIDRRGRWWPVGEVDCMRLTVEYANKRFTCNGLLVIVSYRLRAIVTKKVRFMLECRKPTVADAVASRILVGECGEAPSHGVEVVTI